MKASSTGPRLIVNADDYGYFGCVSRGIVEAAAQGIVTATGVFANSPRFAEYAEWLRECPTLDTGIHLNLTYGVPLTKEMSTRLARWSGRFPGKFSLAFALLSGLLRPDHVRAEWRAQIERCLDIGLRVRFLNSHEHVHMLPSLSGVVAELAAQYGIEHVRQTSCDLAWNSPAALFRTAALKMVSARRGATGHHVEVLGLEVSGKLDRSYLERTIPHLRAGRLYELMCHPGRFDSHEVKDPRLLRYHDWEGELRTLLEPRVRALLDGYCVRLIGYRDLEFTRPQFALPAEAH